MGALKDGHAAGLITEAQLEALAEPLKKSGYGHYLLQILQESVSDHAALQSSLKIHGASNLRATKEQLSMVPCSSPKYLVIIAAGFRKLEPTSLRRSRRKPSGLPQDNHSRSNSGVLRGLHYQLAPEPQAKLVRASLGSIFDVVVDIAKVLRLSATG